MGGAALKVERGDDAVRSTMYRAERRNALSADHLVELRDAVAEAGRLTPPASCPAEGKVFSAGYDFADVTARDLSGMRSLPTLCTDLMRVVQSVPQVIVARVHALATAAGCQSSGRPATSRSRRSRRGSRCRAARAAGSATPPPCRWPARWGASG